MFHTDQSERVRVQSDHEDQGGSGFDGTYYPIIGRTECGHKHEDDCQQNDIKVIESRWFVFVPKEEKKRDDHVHQQILAADAEA